MDGLSSTSLLKAGNPSAGAPPLDVSALSGAKAPTPELKKVFQQFAAGTFYREMLAAMHKGHDKPAYFDGGHAEEVFRSELDSRIADELAERDGDSFAGPLYERFSQNLLASGRL